ncbi:MAG: ARPP-1 family domain-containing protein [Planctomycetota bacterium]|jgi:hypothetical protein
MRSVAGLILIAASVLIAWPRSRPQDPLIPLGDGLALGAVVRAGNLAVWPVLAEQVPDIGPLRTLEEAQARGELGIEECEEAEVATLTIENRGDVPILACAGVIFLGGKQDRQLGADVVVAAHSKVPVKTFCVEQNRWGGGRAFVVNGARATRAVRAAGQYDRDQSGVWRRVDAARASIGLASGSYRAVANTRQTRAERVLAHLRAQEGHVVGYAYSVNGRVMGMRTFAHPALLTARLDAMVRAVCLESEQAGVVSSPMPSDERQRLSIHLQMASDSYDEGRYDVAEAQARQVLALESGNEAARELVRIAGQSRYVGSRDDIRRQFRDEWRTVMAEIEAVDAFAPRPSGYPGSDDGGVDLGGLAVLDDVTSGLDGSAGFLPPQITQLGVTEDDVDGLFDYVLGFDVAEREHEGHVFFAGGIDGDLRCLAEVITLVHGAYTPPAETVETGGVNRNRYAKTAAGRSATCSIRGKDGRWIPVTRDWTAR